MESGGTALFYISHPEQQLQWVLPLNSKLFIYVDYTGWIGDSDDCDDHCGYHSNKHVRKGGG